VGVHARRGFADGDEEVADGADGNEEAADGADGGSITAADISGLAELDGAEVGGGDAAIEYVGSAALRLAAAAGDRLDGPRTVTAATRTATDANETNAAAGNNQCLSSGSEA